MSEYLSSRNGDESIDNEKESYVISLNQYFETLELNSLSQRYTQYLLGQRQQYQLLCICKQNFDIGDFKGILHRWQ